MDSYVSQKGDRLPCSLGDVHDQPVFKAIAIAHAAAIKAVAGVRMMANEAYREVIRLHMKSFLSVQLHSCAARCRCGHRYGWRESN